MMRCILLFYILFSFPALTQQDLIPNGSFENNLNSMDFSLLVIPSNQGASEYYQFGCHRKRSERNYLGMNISVGVAESYSIPQDRSVHYKITAGFTWKILYNRHFFIDPLVHIGYISEFGQLENRSFRGGTVVGGVNMGYEFNQFGIGIMNRSLFAMGHMKRINTPFPENGFAITWDYAQLGLFLTLKF